MQQLEERSAAQDVFTIGCLERIMSWAKNNLLLVAGLSGGLLLLEVKPDSVTPSPTIHHQKPDHFLFPPGRCV